MPALELDRRAPQGRPTSLRRTCGAARRRGCLGPAPAGTRRGVRPAHELARVPDHQVPPERWHLLAPLRADGFFPGCALLRMRLARLRVGPVTTTYPRPQPLLDGHIPHHRRGHAARLVLVVELG